MKKRYLHFAVIFALILSLFLLTACYNNDLPHTHKWSEVYANDSTNHWQTCSGCEEVQNKAAHEYGEWIEVTAATEDATGLKKHICSVCGYEETAIIEKLSHTHKWLEVYANDSTNHWQTCSGCEEVQNKAAHEYGEWIEVTAATEDATGLKKHICSVCGYEETVIIEKLPHTHTWKSPTYEWNDDFSRCTATRICQNDNSHIETETVNSTSSVITSAKCEEDGLGRYIVTFKNSSFEAQTHDVVIEATGHNWNVPTYEWNDDFSQCTATRICQNDNSHIETETVNSTSSVITYSSIDEKCVEKYNATFTKKAFETQIKNITLEYSRIENKIYFGSYPQTLVEDDSLIASLNTNAGELPTATDLKAWTDYNYYSASKVESYMYYQDIDYDNDGDYDYRGVYFTHYRPFHYNSDGLLEKDTYQGDNGYKPNTIYWFKFEPIEWNILNESNGKALIIANLVLDSQDYYPNVSSSMIEHNGGMGYVNNYELSNIRKFINGNFYNDAFNDLEKLIIEITEVDNSASSIDDDLNEYACNNTNDKMFLLSYKEATTYYKTNYSRKTQGTDYAKCQGLNSHYYLFYDGVDPWWLRSPYSNNPEEAYYIYDDSNPSTNSFCPDYGVRPACWLKLTNN